MPYTVPASCLTISLHALLQFLWVPTCPPFIFLLSIFSVVIVLDFAQYSHPFSIRLLGISSFWDLDSFDFFDLPSKSRVLWGGSKDVHGILTLCSCSPRSCSPCCVHLVRGHLIRVHFTRVWFLLIFLDRFWFLSDLIASGFFWSSLIASGSFLISFDRFWFLLISFDRFWFPSDLPWSLLWFSSDFPWSLLVCVWSRAVSDVPAWTPVRLRLSLWGFLVSHSYTDISLTSQLVLLACLPDFDPTWLYVPIYVSVQQVNNDSGSNLLSHRRSLRYLINSVL